MTKLNLLDKRLRKLEEKLDVQQGRRPALIRISELAGWIGLHKNTIYDEVKNGRFPKPIHLGKRAVGWLITEVEEWLDARITARESGPQSNSTRKVQVRATRIGYYGGKRRYQGNVFEVEERDLDTRWMRTISPSSSRVPTDPPGEDPKSGRPR